LGNKGLRLIKARREGRDSVAELERGHAGRASGRRRGAAALAAQPEASRHRGGEDGG